MRPLQYYGIIPSAKIPLKPDIHYDVSVLSGVANGTVVSTLPEPSWPLSVQMPPTGLGPVGPTFFNSGANTINGHPALYYAQNALVNLMSQPITDLVGTDYSIYAVFEVPTAGVNTDDTLVLLDAGLNSNGQLIVTGNSPFSSITHGLRVTVGGPGAPYVRVDDVGLHKQFLFSLRVDRTLGGKIETVGFDLPEIHVASLAFVHGGTAPYLEYSVAPRLSFGSDSSGSLRHDYKFGESLIFKKYINDIQHLDIMSSLLAKWR